MSLKDLTSKFTALETEFFEFVENITNKLDNRELDFIPNAMLALGIFKMRAISLLQEFQNEKAVTSYQIDQAIRATGVKVTEAKISKQIEADKTYQEVNKNISKLKGLIDATTSVSIALSTAVKLWGNNTEVE